MTDRKAEPAWVAGFLAALRKGSPIEAAARAAGVSKGTAYNRRKNHAGFRAAWDATGSGKAPSAPPASRGLRRIGLKKIDYFLDALAESSNVTAAAEAAGIDARAVYRLRRDEPEFARRWYAALAEGYDNLEMQMLEHLRSGEEARASTAAGRKFDPATALRCLTAHRESVAREKGRRTLADEVTTIAAINAKIDALRARAKESDAAIRKARGSKKSSGNGGR